MSVNFSTVTKVRAKNCAECFSAARSYQARQAHDFAVTQSERYPMRVAPEAQVLDPDCCWPRRRFGRHPMTCKRHLQLAANHKMDDLWWPRRRYRQRHHPPPVTQDRNRIAQIKDLIKMMGNVNDRHPGGAQVTDDSEQPPNFTWCERRSRLIEDQQAAGKRQGLADFKQLTLGDTEMLNRRLRIDIETDAFEQRPGSLVEFPVVDQ